MPKLNKLLVTSIIADIRECVHVSNEIYSWLGDIEHLSWKFPTKAAKGINAMEIVREHDGTAGEFYILLLELAYDRLFGTFSFFLFLFLLSLFLLRPLCSHRPFRLDRAAFCICMNSPTMRNEITATRGRQGRSFVDISCLTRGTREEYAR